MGSTLAELWTTAGHQVAIGELGDVDAASALTEALGPSVQTSSVEEAARCGEVVVLTGPFGRAEMVPPTFAVAGRTVIDASNALTEAGEAKDWERGVERDRLRDLARRPRRQALNTLDADTLRAEGRPSVPREKRFGVLAAGDDSRAKERASTLIEEIDFSPIDAGSLALGGRYLEPRSKLSAGRCSPPKRVGSSD